MQRCRYCRWGDPKHGPECPETKEGQEREVAIADYDEGYARGRDIKYLEPEENRSAAYQYGYNTGRIGLEEAQNGFDPVTDGCQW